MPLVHGNSYVLNKAKFDWPEYVLSSCATTICLTFVKTELYRATLQSILPADLLCAVDWIKKDEPVVFEDEVAFIASAGVHRRNEFLTGRRLAREALGETRVLLADVDGLPIWPKSQIASISHSRGLCCAVAGSSVDYICLGLDIEKADRLSQGASRRVVHPLEVSFTGDNRLRASLLFCLKEAFYKAQFPRFRTLANFQDLALKVDLTSGFATVLKLADPFHPELQRSVGQLHFRFGFCGVYVFTICYLLA